MPEISIKCSLIVGRNEIDWIEIEGFRGFGRKIHIDLAKPNGKVGSGLTIIVGPNNSGKSTIIEGFHALAGTEEPSFNELKRNKNVQYKLSIKIRRMNGEEKELRTIKGGGSETEWIKKEEKSKALPIYVLPSRRRFDPFLSGEAKSLKEERENYISNTSMSGNRGEEMDRFAVRIFKWQRDEKRFNSDLKKILGTLPNWSIEQFPSGGFYLKFDYNGFVHTSEGLGDGIINIFFIVDALYDSGEQQTIVIDEPELSLHPSLQKKVFKLLAEYAKDRQIVMATHSPYFVDFDYIKNGAKIIRTVKEDTNINVYNLEQESINKIESLLKDLNNPHIFGLSAREVFFLEDKIILVEGQEDVVFYNKICKDLNIPLSGNFFGWGVGGASKMRIVAQILKDLGFKKVVGILDSDKKDEKSLLSNEFEDYSFLIIPAKDVRYKDRVKEKLAVEGLWKNGKIQEKYKKGITNIFNQINKYLS